MKIEMPEGVRVAAPAKRASEERSIQLVLDHLQLRDDGHTVVKFVMSTQEQLEALAGLAQYYGLSEALASPGNLSLISQMHGEEAAILILTTETNTQVLLAAEDWDELSRRFDTTLELVRFLKSNVEKLYAAEYQAKGMLPVLAMIGLSAAPAQAPAPGDQQSAPKSTRSKKA